MAQVYDKNAIDGLIGALRTEVRTKQSSVQLVDNPTIDIDVLTAYRFKLLLGHSGRTWGNPLNATDGDNIIIAIHQDTVGGRTFPALASNMRYTPAVPSVTLSTEPNAVDLIELYRYNGLWYIIRFVKLSIIVGGGTPDPEVPTDPGTPSTTYPDGTPYPTIGVGTTIVNVANTSQLQAAITALVPGQTIVLADGNYSAATFLVSGKTGTAASGMVIKAANVGGAVFAAGSTWEIRNCQHVTVDGLSFPWEAPSGDGMFKFKGTSAYCRVSRCLFGPTSITTSSVAGGYIYAADDCQHLLIDSNEIRYKGTSGNGIRIYGNFSTYVGCKYVRIMNNYLHDMGPEVGNDKEPIRYGVSTMSRTVANGVIEGNLIARAQAEPENISVKMSNIRVAGNTIRECAGGIVIRHGTDSVMADNYIIDRVGITGTEGLKSGGIRFYDAGHQILRNYIEGTIGTGFQDPILVDTGDATTGGALSAHWNVVSCLVDRNIIVGAGATPNGIGIGDNYNTAPTGSVTNNIVANVASGAALTERIANSMTKSGNVYASTAAGAGLSQDSNLIWRKSGWGPQLPYRTPAMVGPTGSAYLG